MAKQYNFLIYIISILFFIFLSTQNVYANEPSGSLAILQNSTATTVDIVVTGVGFNKFVHSNSTTADVTDLSNITYKSTNPTSAVIDNDSKITITFPVSIGTDKSGSLVILTNTIKNPGDFSNSSSININNTYIVDHAKPVLLSFTSSKSNGTYGPGENVSITATYSENINSGSIVVDLNSHPSSLITLSTISTNTVNGTYIVGSTGSGQDVIGLDVVTISTQNILDALSNTNNDTSLPSINITTQKNIAIDTTAPTNQDTLFASSVSKKGGSSVDVITSVDQVNRWLAPIGTNIFTESSTTTKASSDGAESILSPVTEGNYKLFAIDPVGNISNPSTATLTVDNTPPSAPIANPVAGTYTSIQSASISSADSSIIRYTADGTVPATCSSGLEYNGAVSISSSQTIRAIGCDLVGNISDVSFFAYIIDIPSGNGGGGVVVGNGSNSIGYVRTYPDFIKSSVANVITAFSSDLSTTTLDSITVTKSTTTPKRIKFTKNMRKGTVGSEVLMLQKALNELGFIVSETGDGSIGRETNYFGLKTEKAVHAYQLFYSKEILIPQDITQSTGLFLRYSKAKMNQIFEANFTNNTTTPMVVED